MFYSICFVNKLPINLKEIMRVIIIIKKLEENKVKYHIPQRKLFYTLISYTGKKPISHHIFAISNINITEKTQIMCAMILENKLFK